MKKWMIITGLIVLSVISYLFIDSRIIDYTDGTPVKYMELPKEVQDSLVWRGRHDGCVSIEDTVIVRYKPVICFDSDYTMLYFDVGPWTFAHFLKRNSDGKIWKFKGIYNIPKPIVTIGDTLYVPSEYNINSGDRVDDNAVFYRHIL